MGFLDGLLSDLLSSATRSAGSNIGHQLTDSSSLPSMGSSSHALAKGRDVLQIGAALVGAGLIAKELFQQPSGQPSGQPTPPPPPPLLQGAQETTVVLPPLPPLPPLPHETAVAPALPHPPLPPLPPDAANGPTAPSLAVVLAPRELSFALARAMVAAAMADGSFGPEERQTIEKRLAEAEFDAAQKHLLELDLQNPATPEELVRLVTDPGQREALYRFAGLVILADRHVAQTERTWLDRLAVTLGYDQTRKQGLEQQIFNALV